MVVYGMMFGFIIKWNDTVYCALVNNSASRTPSDAKKKIK